MPNYLMICEKPSLMRDVRECYNKHKAEINSKVGNIDFIALSGHVCTNAEPNDYEDWNEPWKMIDYPMVPKHWNVKPIDDARKRKTISDIKKSINNYDGIIVGTDSDVEGYGIYDLLERYLGFEKIPALRFIEHSLTDAEILKSLLSMTDYHVDTIHTNFVKSFRLRSLSDWLFGMNATRYMTVKKGKLITIGRVISIVIRLVYDNSMAIKNFTPKKTFGEKAEYEQGFSATLVNGKEQMLVDDPKDLPHFPPTEGEIISIEQKDKYEHAPKLYDLAAIQIEAGSAFGYSPSDTLKYIQSLYETHKIISYPRTQCRFVSSEKAKEFPNMLKQALVFSELKPALMMITKDSIANVNKDKAVVNDKEVQKESHDALLPTSNTPDLSKLSTEEKNICFLIYKRLVAQFLPKCQTKATTMTIRHGVYDFKANGQVVINQGWRGLYKEANTNELPALKRGDKINAKFMVKQVVSKPPKRLNESTLIRAMENVSDLIEDKELKATLSESKGIGTPATRATIISNAIKRGYIEKKKDGLYITSDGEVYIDAVKNIDISDPVFAALIDMDIKKIQRGELDFDSAYKVVLDKLNDMCVKIGGLKQVEWKNEEQVDVVCNKCNQYFSKDKYYYKCICRKLSRFIAGAEITEKDLKTLVEGKKTGLKKCKSKEGKSFEGRIVLSDEGYNFDFSSGINCPFCGSDMSINRGGAFCRDEACGLKIFRRKCERLFTDEELKVLIKNRSLDNLSGFVSKGKKQFTAGVRLDDNKNVVFDFD